MRALVILAFLAGTAPVSIKLPDGLALYPELPGVSADAINGNCLACHSTEMVLTQPRLTRAEWTAEVAKMRSVYKAPVDAQDDPAIIAWLTAWSDRLPQSAG